MPQPEIYLAPWVRNTGEDFSFWDSIWPDRTIGRIDLRSLPPQALATGVGYGSFTTDGLVRARPDVYHLGSDLDRRITDTERTLAERLFNVGPIRSTNVKMLIRDLLGVYSDPTGATAAKPLMPDRNLKLRLGFSKWSEDFGGFDSPDGQKMLGVIQEDYRHNRDADIVIGSTHYKQTLGALVRKYRGLVSFENFIPSDLPVEEPDDPSTVLQESFFGDDRDQLGYDQSWTEITGDIDNTNNAAQNVTVNGNAHVARVDTDLASADHYCQGVLLNVGNGVTTGQIFIFRKDSSSTLTFYRVDLVHSSINQRFRTFKRIAGDYTALGDNDILNGTINDLLKGQIDGSTIKRFLNGSLQDEVDDTAITGFLRCGLAFFDNSGASTRPRIGTWEAGDISEDSSGPLIGGRLLGGGSLMKSVLVR